MKLFYRLLLVLVLFATYQPTFAQLVGPRLQSSFYSISQNSISNLAVYGDSVWISPLLQRNIGRTTDWTAFDALDSIFVGNGRAYSLVLAQDTVFAGIGRVSELDGQNIDEAFGYYLSIDGGQNWEYLPFQTEEQTETTFLYGGQNITKLPVTVKQQSPPYSVAIKGNTLFSASWASGIVRSLDAGQTWKRLLLPPTVEDSLVPSKTYNFEFNPRNDNNFLGFAVFIDSNNNTWLGSAGGVNISPNALIAPTDSVVWYHKKYDSAKQNSMLGNWVIHITQQPETERIWMTNWVAQSGENFAISYTDDYGKNFKSFLLGEKIYDITFYQGLIIAVGDNGIFISSDDGITWDQRKTIRSANSIVSQNAKYFTADAGSDGVWIGSNEGLIFTSDFSTFEITRINFPLSGGNQFEPDAKTVSTYAYPNPFSPASHTYSRIVFEASTNASNAKVSLYDFSMAKIRDLSGSITVAGTYEAYWDGTDARGRLVANGVVFYIVEVDGKKYDGKILVID